MIVSEINNVSFGDKGYQGPWGINQRHWNEFNYERMKLDDWIMMMDLADSDHLSIIIFKTYACY